MESEFWIKAWEEGRTNFNQKSYNQKLVEFFPSLDPLPGQSVLVPLAGKSVDLIWLAKLGLHVRGVELYEKAVLEFFIGNNFDYQVTTGEKFRDFTHRNISISCGDYFNLSEENTFDLVYDRAALVALPESMREGYVKTTARALKPGGKYLLIVYEYDQSKLEGPPFSISEAEVKKLYEKDFTISLVDNRRPENEGERLSAMTSLSQKVYILQKKSQ